jgi:predicted nucleotidyltransferase
VVRTRDDLVQIVTRRLTAASRVPHEYFEQASEIVVFGSMSVGLDGPTSDIDVLCVGGQECKLRANALDLLVVSQDAIEDSSWLQSELASHVSQYGIWIKGVPNWRMRARIGLTAVEEKRRRVAAFMKYLPESWPGLNQRFRRKYAMKVRREAQRLLLLERGVPIPPTRILDTGLDGFSECPCEILECLRRFASSAHYRFVEEFFVHIIEHFPSAASDLSEGDVNRSVPTPPSFPELDSRTTTVRAPAVIASFGPWPRAGRA